MGYCVIPAAGGDNAKRPQPGNRVSAAHKLSSLTTRSNPFLKFGLARRQSRTPSITPVCVAVLCSLFDKAIPNSFNLIIPKK
ncbi:hypothetical protein SL267_03840 [Serratia marcescens]|nr:hypothetical protein SL267_03840 [Serratia marcescens]